MRHDEREVAEHGVGHLEDLHQRLDNAGLDIKRVAAGAVNCKRGSLTAVVVVGTGLVQRRILVQLKVTYQGGSMVIGLTAMPAALLGLHISVYTQAGGPMSPTHAERIVRVSAFAEGGGGSIRGGWANCLLAAYSPEAQASKSLFVCPTDILPLWMVHLLAYCDDLTPAESAYRLPMLTRWPGALAPADQWTPEQWGLLLRRHLIRCLDITAPWACSGQTSVDAIAAATAIAGVRSLLVTPEAKRKHRVARAIAEQVGNAFESLNSPLASQVAIAAATAAVLDDPHREVNAVVAYYGVILNFAGSGARDDEPAIWATLTDALLSDMEALGRGEVCTDSEPGPTACAPPSCSEQPTPP